VEGNSINNNNPNILKLENVTISIHHYFNHKNNSEKNNSTPDVALVLSYIDKSGNEAQYTFNDRIYILEKSKSTDSLPTGITRHYTYKLTNIFGQKNYIYSKYIYSKENEDTQLKLSLFVKDKLFDYGGADYDSYRIEVSGTLNYTDNNSQTNRSGAPKLNVADDGILLFANDDTRLEVTTDGIFVYYSTGDGDNKKLHRRNIATNVVEDIQLV
jgi:hypothetical protein